MSISLEFIFYFLKKEGFKVIHEKESKYIYYIQTKDYIKRHINVFRSSIDLKASGVLGYHRECIRKHGSLWKKVR